MRDVIDHLESHWIGVKSFVDEIRRPSLETPLTELAAAMLIIWVDQDGRKEDGDNGGLRVVVTVAARFFVF